jgi:hypothetical protein
MGGEVDLLAYCGLYCGDCAGYSGELADAARSLLDVIDRYGFDRTARDMFRAELPDYDGFRKALEFVSGLRCSATCREREKPCVIAACAIEKGFEGCYDCDDFRACDRLASLTDVHGDACVRNIESIRSMGPEAWVETGTRLWFGSGVDESTPSE